MTGQRRILVVNPNTSEEVTQAFLAAARAVAPGEVVFDGVTGRFGARIVSTEAENIIAGHSVLDLVAAHAPGHDAVILAISFDTGLGALRRLLNMPVIGITEAAVRAAAANRRRVGVVIFGEVSRVLYEDLIAGYDVAVVGMESVEIASAADYLAPEDKDRRVEKACRNLVAQGAEAVVICGAAIVGMAARLQERVLPVPLFDGTQAVAMCIDLLEAGNNWPVERTPPVGGTVGLSPELAEFLQEGVLKQ